MPVLTLRDTVEAADINISINYEQIHSLFAHEVKEEVKQFGHDMQESLDSFHLEQARRSHFSTDMD